MNGDECIGSAGLPRGWFVEHSVWKSVVPSQCTFNAGAWGHAPSVAPDSDTGPGPLPCYLLFSMNCFGLCPVIRLNTVAKY